MGFTCGYHDLNARPVVNFKSYSISQNNYTSPYKNEVIGIIIDISTDKKHFTVINYFCHIAQHYVHYFVVFKWYAGNIKILGNLKYNFFL